MLLQKRVTNGHSKFTKVSQQGTVTVSVLVVVRVTDEVV